MTAQHTPVPWAMNGYRRIFGHGGSFLGAISADEVPLVVAFANAAFVVVAVNNHERMLAALEAMVELCDGMDGEVYGSFHGGDPRRFKPDEDSNTPEEIAAWKAACAEWDAGTGVNRGPGCQTFGDASVVTGTGFGVGTTTLPETPELTQAKAAIRAARGDEVPA